MRGKILLFGFYETPKSKSLDFNYQCCTQEEAVRSMKARAQKAGYTDYDILIDDQVVCVVKDYL